MLAVCDYAEGKIELNKKKHLPSHEDLNPNTKFINNKIFEAFRNNSTINNLYSNVDFNWSDYPEFIKSIWLQITTADYYKTYTSSEDDSIKEDIKIIDKIISKILVENSELDEILEEKSIFWNDESEFIVSMVIKTLKEFAESKGSEQVFMNEFKDEEDKEFVATLFRDALLKQKEFVALINKFAKNWDLERVAFMDIIIMQVGLTEVSGGFNIPVKVTLNEYIEIAKHYSTPKSGMFVNGILDKIVGHLAKEGRVSMIE